jgi:uncharacterized delta-60 repeat protein
MNRFFLVFGTALLGTGLWGQTAVNDATFNPGDVGFGVGSGFFEPPTGPMAGLTNGVGNCMLALPDNKVLIGGSWDSRDAWLVKKLVRLNENGSIDFTFNTGDGFNGEVLCMSLQSDGKILVGGDFTAFDGAACNRICRLNANGTFDPSFVAIPGCDAAVRDIQLVPGNRLVIGGDFTSVGGAARNKLARLNLDGSNDGTFNIGGSGIVGQVRCLALLSGGKVVVGGQIASYNGTARNNLLRINADGSLDGTYLATVGSGANNLVNDVEVQGTTHLVAGAFGTFSGSNVDGLVRLTETGSIDALWPIGLYPGIVTISDVTALQGGGYTWV